MSGSNNGWADWYNSEIRSNLCRIEDKWLSQSHVADYNTIIPDTYTFASAATTDITWNDVTWHIDWYPPNSINYNDSVILSSDDLIDKEPINEHETLPIIAQRYAGMIFGYSGVQFKSIVSSHGSFGVDAEAKCLRNVFKNSIISHNEAPEWTCICGFYAVPADKLPKHSLARCPTGDSKQVILQVELTGRVIIHDEGYRAQYQKVLEVKVPDCHCGKESKFIWYSPRNKSIERIDCGEHKTPQTPYPLRYSDPKPNATAVSIDRVSKLLEIPFTRHA